MKSKENSALFSFKKPQKMKKWPFVLATFEKSTVLTEKLATDHEGLQSSTPHLRGFFLAYQAFFVVGKKCNFNI